MKARTLSSIFLNFSILSYWFLNIHPYRAYGSRLPHTFFTVWYTTKFLFFLAFSHTIVNVFSNCRQIEEKESIVNLLTDLISISAVVCVDNSRGCGPDWSVNSLHNITTSNFIILPRFILRFFVGGYFSITHLYIFYPLFIYFLFKSMLYSIELLGSQWKLSS
jgi:hypothetical protein